MGARAAFTTELWACRRSLHKGEGNWHLPAGMLKRLERRFFSRSPGLHLFSGSLHLPYALNIDIRPEVKPDIVALAQQLPFPEDSFPWVFADPPYSDEWGRTIWKTGPLRLYRVMREICRVVEPGGLILWLDLRPWTWPRVLRTEAFIAVLAGPRSRVRLLHVLRKQAL